MIKLLALLQSRKFWALIAALAAIICGVIYGQMPIPQAIQAAIAALSAYMIGTGLDNGPVGNGQVNNGPVDNGQAPPPAEITARSFKP